MGSFHIRIRMTITRISRHIPIYTHLTNTLFWAISIIALWFIRKFFWGWIRWFRRRGSKKIIIFIVRTLSGLKKYNYPHKQRYVTHIFVAFSFVCQPWSFASYSCSTRLEKIRCEAFQLVMCMKTTGNVKHDFWGYEDEKERQ